MNVMEDNEYDTNDRRRNLLLTTSSQGSFLRKLGGTPPAFYFFLGGGGRGEEVAWQARYTQARSIISHCSAIEPVLQETGPTTAAEIEPTFYEESGLLSVEIINFIHRCISRNMNQPASKLSISSCKWSKPQDNAWASDPTRFLLCWGSFRVACDFSSPMWGVCSQGLCALAACHESGISFVYFKPKQTRTTKIIFSRSQERKGKLSTGL